MTEQAADTAIEQACHSLRLPTMRSRFVEIAEGWSNSASPLGSLTPT
jgi:hypothetical protein